nr:MAG TPA: hypothetical protein [Caudoviricetes sp.]
MRNVLLFTDQKTKRFKVLILVNRIQRSSISRLIIYTSNPIVWVGIDSMILCQQSQSINLRIIFKYYLERYD